MGCISWKALLCQLVLIGYFLELSMHHVQAMDFVIAEPGLWSEVYIFEGLLVSPGLD